MMQTQVVSTVADSYYALLMLDEQIRITEQTAESWREYVRTLAALMQAGQEALWQFRQSLLDAGNEVNNALTQWQTARERIVLDEAQVEQLTLTVQDTELLMENSADTNYLQVLTARQSLLSAQLTVASDRYDEIQGVIELYHALGGGSD